jgi:type IV pilus assembly protein PilW
MSLLVMGGVTSVFVSTSDSNRRLQGLAEMQDNARFAINYMKGAFQGAAYSGCMAGDTMVTNDLAVDVYSAYARDFTTSMVGYESTGATSWSPGLDGSITSPLGGSDIVTVRGAVGPAVNVQAGMVGTNSAVPISTNHYFAATSPILLVSDCGGTADIFQKTNTAAGTAAHATGTGTNASANLSRVYGPGNIVVPIDTTTFYLRTNTDGINSLYVIEGTGTPMEMVRGVDGMQILYGVTTITGTATANDISANEYVTADNVANWANVVSVRIGLLLSTPATVTRQPDTAVYSVLGTAYGPFGDRRLRRLFDATFSLRNRSL